MIVFLLSDNKKMFFEIKRILGSIADLHVDFYCSPESQKTFENEISKKLITPKNIKRNFAILARTYDLGISCHSKQIFPPDLVKSVRCINIHPGFNPHNRGWYPQIFSIINGFPAGATIHEMDPKIDHGAVIVQEQVEIFSNDTSLSLYNRILKKEVELLEININRILRNEYTPSPLENDGNFNTKQDFRKLCEIDLDRKVTYREAINKLRALSHDPYSNAYFYDKDGRKIYISIKLNKMISDDG